MFDTHGVITDSAQYAVPSGVAPGRDDEEELSQLIHKAILARRFVDMHRHATRQCLRAARAANDHGDFQAAKQLLVEARDEHAQARTCLRYARECECRADAIAIAAGAYAVRDRCVRHR